jgi:hypothetical protein
MTGVVDSVWFAIYVEKNGYFVWDNNNGRDYKLTPNDLPWESEVW